jgi:hypothetical protein
MYCLLREPVIQRNADQQVERKRDAQRRADGQGRIEGRQGLM